jgi:hypothetical protein
MTNPYTTGELLPKDAHRCIEIVSGTLLAINCNTAAFNRVESYVEHLEQRVKELEEAAKAVVDRWQSPLWKDLPHTGEFIARLDAAIGKKGGE